MIYRIFIEESATRDFEVEANSLDEALKKGQDDYASILGPVGDDDVSFRQIKVCGPDEDGDEVETEWDEI